MNHRDPGNSFDSGESEVIVNLEILVNMVIFLFLDSCGPGILAKYGKSSDCGNFD